MTRSMKTAKEFSFEELLVQILPPPPPKCAAFFFCDVVIIHTLGDEISVSFGRN